MGNPWKERCLKTAERLEVLPCQCLDAQGRLLAPGRKMKVECLRCELLRTLRG